MRPKSIMLIAGEASGDLLAAELVGALRRELTADAVSYTPDQQPLKTGLEPRFFGAGGPRMKAAGVELAFDLTEHSVIGISDVLKRYFQFRRLFRQLLALAREREPDAIIGVDYGGFNLRFAHAIRTYARSRRGWFHDWQPKIVQYVSPQVWASRAGRAYQMARDHDLVLSLFPFEKAWYAKTVPGLHVEFVGHPMIDRLTSEARATRSPEPVPAATSPAGPPRILLLPGSRVKELQRHIPVMLAALKQIRKTFPAAHARMVLPSAALVARAAAAGANADCEIQVGNLHAALAAADLAITKTGTVSMECAFFGIPAVTLYKTSGLTFAIGKRIVKVNSLTMPNLLANGEIYPEFIQDAATAENISRAATELLQSEPRRADIRQRLTGVVASLGGPGASCRAARAIAHLLK